MRYGAGMQLAQVNVSRLLEPLDAPRLADFVAALDPVNALADAAPGFVWRLQTEDGDATAIRVFDDPMIIINLTVWESVDALAAFTFNSDHTAVMRRRREWFHRLREASTALWWVPDGHRPTPHEAQARLEHLRRHGPGAHAFTFRAPFPPPGSDDVTPPADDWLCPA